MQAKRATGVVKALKDVAQVAANTPSQDLAAKLDQAIRLIEEGLHLQRVALLDSGHVLRFQTESALPVALALPEAQDDFTQKSILKARGFHRAKLLAAVQAMGLIGPQTTLCDIGANIGNDVVFFGRVLGARRIVAFEPLPLTHATLRRNLDMNGLADAHAYNCMLGEISGRGEIARFNPRNLAATSFKPVEDGPIPMVALDDLIDAEEFNGLGFIKLDAEGAEPDILRGGVRILAAMRPTLWLTLRDGALADAARLLTPMGYTSQKIGPNDHVFTAK